MGVRRALNIVLNAAHRGDSRVFTLGPLIHNPQVIDLLRRRGICPVEDEEELLGETVVIRAHGISPQEHRDLDATGAIICDATCPRVMRVQKIIERYVAHGYEVVVVGDRGHAEVVGLLGFARGHGTLVEGPDEAEKLPQYEKLCVVAQTTQNREVFRQAVEVLRGKAQELEVFDTLCDSTSRRQREALEFAQSSDAVVVVGGRTSANTRRLAEICKATGTPTFHIETEEELNRESLKRFSQIAVTAGASTPNWMINRAVGRIEDILGIRPSIPGKVLRLATNLNLQLALGAACLTAFGALIQGFALRVEHVLVSALYVLAMHTINTLTDVESLELNEPRRAKFYSRHRKKLLVFALVCGLGTLVAALRLGLWPLAIVAVSSLVGPIYNLRIFPAALAGITGYRKLRDIPGSRDLFIALAWSVITALVPAISAGSFKLGFPSALALLFPFTITFIRSVTLDLRDIEGDRMVGNETIPVALGMKWTKALVLVVVSGTFLLAALSAASGWAPPATYYVLPSLLFIYVYLYLYHIRVVATGPFLDWLVDGNFIVIALSLAARLLA
jgi:4-hydroxy-3-methylbut-2-enyl diphosphate reductase